MKLALILLAAFLSVARADFVIVQKVDGAGAQSGNVTFKIKDGKARIDVTPQITQLIDSGTGDTITLMHAQKAYMKISAEQTKAMIEQMRALQEAAGPAATAPAKLVATGQKEKVEQWDTEVFTWSNGTMSARYWIAKDFPNYAAIMAAMEKATNGGLAGMTKGIAPSGSDFPGMAVKTEVKMMGKTITSTVVSADEKAVDAKEVTVPADYKEMATPALNFTPPPAK